MISTHQSRCQSASAVKHPFSFQRHQALLKTVYGILLTCLQYKNTALLVRGDA